MSPSAVFHQNSIAKMYYLGTTEPSTVSLLCSQTLAHFPTSRQSATPLERQRKAGCLVAQKCWLNMGPEPVPTGHGGWRTWRGSWGGRWSCWTKKERPWGWKRRNKDKKLTGASINCITESQGSKKVGIERQKKDKRGRWECACTLKQRWNMKTRITFWWLAPLMRKKSFVFALSNQATGWFMMNKLYLT